MKKEKKKSILKKNILLLLLIVAIGIFPLLFIKGAEFGGSDDKGEEMIQKINPNYKPWAKNLFELPGGEVESLLFALQAAVGAGVVCYVLGYLKGRKKGREENANR